MKTIAKDQLVSRKRGWVTYVDESGVKKTARSTEVRVEGDEEKAPKPAKAKAVKPARAPKTETDGEGDEGEDGPKLRRIGNTRHDCSGYEKTTSASGNTSLDSGDGLAVELRGLELDDVYSKAAKLLGETIKTLKARYEKLNPGMQRMNLGNRMRAAVRKSQAAA